MMIAISSIRRNGSEALRRDGLLGNRFRRGVCAALLLLVAAGFATRYMLTVATAMKVADLEQSSERVGSLSTKLMDLESRYLVAQSAFTPGLVKAKGLVQAEPSYVVQASLGRSVSLLHAR